ncbi:MAG TPA: RNA methyltransferase [Pusillimonas sp.]|uniref:TrmH family RNA methyltransferase n=1 Tax=unclassified Pusillimonas TaxID=2640016 RepID=UPI00262AD146|nr:MULTISPECIES: RNA methyltransferase [unclassified Pusillimonas]HLU19772.1 RNA methyltransferase [Pusillimonas sp.]
MKQITSRENPRFKQFARLATGRRKDQTLLEGVHLCQEWLRHRGLPVYALFDLERLQRDPQVAELLDRLPSDRVAGCEPSLARRLSQVPENQGVYFLVEVRDPKLPAQIGGMSLWLDRVQDPGNLGTLLRTAAAAGIDQAFLSRGCAGAWTPKVLRSGQGAHFVMGLYEDLDLLALRQKLVVPLIATALDDAVSLYEVALPVECAWLMGNEGQGVSADLLKLADRRVFIPQVREVESLNVAAAAAVCLFEHRRQRLLAL